MPENSEPVTPPAGLPADIAAEITPPTPAWLTKFRKVISRTVAPLWKKEPLSGPAKVVLTCLATHSSGPYISPDEWERFENWDAEHARQEKIVNATTRDASYTRWEKHRQDHHKQTTETGEISSHILTRDEFQNRDLLVHNSAKKREEQLYCENLELVRDLAGRIAAIVHDVACNRQDGEKAEYARWGVAWPGPSPLVAYIFRVETMIRATGTPDVSTNGPRGLFPFLPFEPLE